jgi:hypothetical protein
MTRKGLYINWDYIFNHWKYKTFTIANLRIVIGVKQKNDD